MKIKIEPLLEVKDKIEPLCKLAWEEVDQVGEYFDLDPDWELMDQIEQMGMWKTYTYYTDDDELVGFVCVIIQPLIHARSIKQATTDVAYVKKEHRGSFKALLEAIEEDLKGEGCKWFTFTLKAWDARGGFLEGMGYKHHENVYQKAVN